jgi:N-glycosylase/DNA lyase
LSIASDVVELFHEVTGGLPMTIHEQIVAQYEAYIAENQKFTEKGIKASAARARKALGEIAKLAKDRRKEIQEEKSEI